MFSILIIVLFSTSVVYSVSNNAYCCKPEHFLINGVNDSQVCVDAVYEESPLLLACPNHAMITEDVYNFQLKEDGSLLLLVPNNKVEVESEKFCIGNFTSSTNETSITNFTRAAVVCADEDTSLVANDAMAYCMVVSVVFLTLTALIYAILPEIRDLQGKSIINFCASLALGLLCLAIMNLISSYSNMDLCAVRGFLTYFFLIVSFFWTNAISIQILRCMRRPFIVDYGWREFGWYALYAWGSGALLTIAMAIVNFHPGDHQKPGIGLNHCWFFSKKQQWYYLYSVMTILILTNICIFIYTSILLWRQSFASTHVKALKYKFFMTIRLFIIMGVPWIFEMIGSLLPDNIIWVILDFVNILQGPLIFVLLVVFRRRVVKALHRRGYLECVSGQVEKYLALADDDEEHAIQHTMDVAMDEKTAH